MVYAEAAGLGAAGYALTALAHGVCAWLVWRQAIVRRDATRALLLFIATIAVSALWGLFSLVDLGSSKLWSWHLALGLDQLRYALWGLFLLQLLQPLPALAPLWRALADWKAPARWHLLALVLAGALCQGWVAVAQPDDDISAQWLGALGLAWSVSLLLLIEQLFRNESGESRWGTKPLYVGLAGMALFDVYLHSQAMMFHQVDEDVLAARGLVHGLTTPLLWLAFHRQAGWTRRLQLSRGAAFYSATMLLIGVYLMFTAGVGYYLRYFGGSWGGVLQVVLLFAAAVVLSVLMLSGATRARLRVFLGKNFFSYRYDYRREWLRFTAMLSSTAGPQDVGALVVRGLADMVESPGGSLWYKALGDEGYAQSARWNMPECRALEAPDSAFCHYLRQREWIFAVDAPASPPSLPAEAEAAPAPPGWLQQLGKPWVVVPLLVGGELTGFVVLAQPRTLVELNWEVRDLLKTAARQAAGFLAQMHAAEALLEARKFDAFNRMSAFVVHDLKNIITQLSLMLKNAERHRHNPEFQQDMLITVESSLDKMRQLMLQLREGAKPTGLSSGVDLSALLHRVQQMAGQRGRELQLQLTERLHTRGHEERLERVVGHLVQNALDATPPSGKVWVRLQLDSGRVQLTVGDTGAGMTQDFIQNHLFRPFRSTKSSGMGIGSYESYQYIKELGGSMDVKSEVGRGSEITVLLPLFEQRTATDLRLEGSA